MKKEIDKLTREIFNNQHLLTSIGFSKQESEIFYYLIQGLSISDIAQRLELPYREVRKIKNKRFHLIPVFLQRKLTQFSKFDLSNINLKLVQLNTVLSKHIEIFKSTQVYALKELNLSKRTLNSLIASNIHTTEDLTKYSKHHLMGLKNIGDTSIQEIIIVLDQLNLSLRKKH